MDLIWIWGWSSYISQRWLKTEKILQYSYSYKTYFVFLHLYFYYKKTYRTTNLSEIYHKVLTKSESESSASTSVFSFLDPTNLSSAMLLSKPWSKVLTLILTQIISIFLVFGNLWL